MDFSLQLYSIKEDTAADFDHALGLVKKAGYSGVEFAGYYGHSAEDIKKMLDGHGLKAVGAHIGIGRLKDAFDEEVMYAEALGFKYLICPYFEFKNADDVIGVAKILEDCAAKAKQKGMIVAFHNHAQEFQKFDGRYVLDILFEHAPSVKWQADVYWVAYAGLDPVQVLKPYVESGRLCMIHAKEIAKDSKENVYIGQGGIDFRALFSLCPPQDYPYIVEQEEYTGDRFDGICQCIKGLRAAL